jgi:hypothetical protein
MMFTFVAYFASVQVNAIGYLAGTGHLILSGTFPPVPFTSPSAAGIDIGMGVFVEMLAAIDVLIAALLCTAGIREAMGRRRERAGRSRGARSLRPYA